MIHVRRRRRITSAYRNVSCGRACKTRQERTVAVSQTVLFKNVAFNARVCARWRSCEAGAQLRSLKTNTGSNYNKPINKVTNRSKSQNPLFICHLVNGWDTSHTPNDVTGSDKQKRTRSYPISSSYPGANIPSLRVALYCAKRSSKMAIKVGLTKHSVRAGGRIQPI